MGEHQVVLGPGDSIYYDSSTPHGMIAVEGENCTFYAIVLNPTGEPIPELSDVKNSKTEIKGPIHKKDPKERIYNNFIDIVISDNQVTGGSHIHSKSVATSAILKVYSLIITKK